MLLRVQVMAVVADEVLVGNLSPDYFGDVVQPIHRRTVDGVEYVDEYRYDSVVMEFEPSDVFVGKATWRVCDNGNVIYKYPGKAPVMVTERGVHPPENISAIRAQNQAYFVLSQLDAGGYVRRFQKVGN